MIIRSFSLFTMSLAFVGAAVLGLPADQKVQKGERLQSALSGACLPSQMRGNDVGAKINACDAKLGSGKGTIRLTGGGTIATPVVISPNHTLQVVSGTYAGKNDAGGVKPFTIVAVYNGTTADAPNGSLARNVVVKGCHFKGARADFDSA